MAVLSKVDITEVYQAGIAVGLANHRPALLAGIGVAAVGLAVTSAPGPQVLTDLHALNDMELLADGSCPLAEWLRAASILAMGRREAEVFRRALGSAEEFQRAHGGAQNPAVPAPAPRNVGRNVALNGAELKELHAVLLEAFPKRGDLEQLVRFELNENLAQISGGGSLRDVVFELIQYCSAHGKLAALIEGARAHNPGNPRLAVFARRFE